MDFKVRGNLIVGFVGKAGSGKSTVANSVCTKVFSFADEVKEVAYSLGWDGKKDAKGRRLLQHVGDVGREYNPNIWIDLLAKEMHMQVMDDVYYGDVSIYGIDDVRFDNECEFIREHDGIIIELKHDKIILGKVANAHKSEKGVSSKYKDYTVPWGSLDRVTRETGAIIKAVYEQRTNTFISLGDSKGQAQA